MCRYLTLLLLAGLALFTGGGPAIAQGPLGNDQYAFKIYAVDVGYYPIVQVYFRTWDQNRDPLRNVNYANIGVMVKGRNYEPTIFDPQTRQTQYTIETLQNRQEGFRTVLVLDCSLSMAGKPFADAQNALIRYVEAKRPADQIGIIAIRDEAEGFQLVSGFEKDPTLLFQRIADIKCDGKTTRLYDAIAGAMEMAGAASQGSSSNAAVEHSVLNSIVVLSDGHDEGSAVARDELMNRIGQLDVPVPIFSLAYSKSNTDHFRNLEALSKGSFGRYWTHGDSQEFAATVQKIHDINRSDYVVSFRSYVDVDGGQHPFKIGLAYPSNTGRFIWEDGNFEAIDSPAQYIPETQAKYQSTQALIPVLANACPYVGCAPAAMAAPPAAAPAPATAPPAPVETAPAAAPATETPATTTAKEEEDGEEEEKSFLEENGALLGLGAGILALLIAILSWVRGGGGPKGGGGTSPGGRHSAPRLGSSYDVDTEL